MINLIKNAPSNPFELRKFILASKTEEVLCKSFKYIKNDYQEYELLELCETFNRHDLIDCPFGDVESLSRVGFFPWVEAMKELDNSLSLILYGKYKNSYDSLRRSLELVVTGVFFTSEKSEYIKAREWMESERGTPNFKRAIAKLISLPVFEDVEKKYNWSSKLLKLYWNLSDIVHVKGVDSSLDKISPSFSSFNGIKLPYYHEESMKKCLDNYILITRSIVTVVVMSNPILLLGLDLDKKFGMNPPTSGFFYPVQSERILKLIEEEYRDFFILLLGKNEAIKGAFEWFKSLPDITDQELEQQAKDFNEMYMQKNT